MKEKKGILLDIGCGGAKQDASFVGMDKRALPGVDIVHDVEVFPWPLKDNSVNLAVCSHLLEHIKPWLTIDFFNEIWRVMQPDGKLVIACPYGISSGWQQDPTHCNVVIEATFQYFDPQFPLWQIYKPKPWKIAKGFPAWESNGHLECVLYKMEEGEVSK